eukprot:Amastigsp_a4354_12.p2 type:complete len:212 gc:universal Amastigsp_a4354_12:647-12(-)
MGFKAERDQHDDGSVQAALDEENKPVSLDECFGWFSKEERMDEADAWRCPQCADLRRATKKLDLWRVPPVLIVHLKRFQFYRGRWVKSRKLVDFPLEGFTPSDYLVDPRTRENPPVYDLYAVTNHLGSLGGGHYLAYVRHRDGKFYTFNDSSCDAIEDLAQIKSPAAYVLFYRLRGSDAGDGPFAAGPARPLATAGSDDGDDAPKRECVIL